MTLLIKREGMTRLFKQTENKTKKKKNKTDIYIENVFIQRILPIVCLQYTIQQHNVSWLSAVEGALGWRIARCHANDNTGVGASSTVTLEPQLFHQIFLQLKTNKKKSKIKISEKGFYSKGAKQYPVHSWGGCRGINRLEVVIFIWECRLWCNLNKEEIWNTLFK